MCDSDFSVYGRMHVCNVFQLVEFPLMQLKTEIDVLEFRQNRDTANFSNYFNSLIFFLFCKRRCYTHVPICLPTRADINQKSLIALINEVCLVEWSITNCFLRHSVEVINISEKSVQKKCKHFDFGNMGIALASDHIKK